MRNALGVAVFSGMLGVTLFGIFFTPVFYYVLERLAGGTGAAARSPQPAARSRSRSPRPRGGAPTHDGQSPDKSVTAS